MSFTTQNSGDVPGVQVLERPRAGGRTLSLLAVPLNGLILRALGDAPLRLAELRGELGGPAQTTLRGHLRKLAEVGAILKEGGGMPYSVENELSGAGRDLLAVTEAVAGWLRRAPDGPVPLGSVGAKGAIKALTGGWESTMLRAFAARPLSLTQLDRLIADLSYPSLERRLSAMRVTGLVGPGPTDGERTPYLITRWAREGVGPVAAAARFERTHLASETTPLTAIDIEAAFLLATPIAALSADADGTCQLAAHTGNGRRKLAGARVSVDRGRVVECISQLESRPRNFAVGQAEAWLDAIVAGDPGGLRIGGDEDLAIALVDGLHEALFATSGRAPSDVAEAVGV